MKQSPTEFFSPDRGKPLPLDVFDYWAGILRQEFPNRRVPPRDVASDGGNRSKRLVLGFVVAAAIACVVLFAVM
jgi:hypothetical protein